MSNHSFKLYLFIFLQINQISTAISSYSDLHFTLWRPIVFHIWIFFPGCECFPIALYNNESCFAFWFVVLGCSWWICWQSSEDPSISSGWFWIDAILLYSCCFCTSMLYVCSNACFCPLDLTGKAAGSRCARLWRNRSTQTASSGYNLAAGYFCLFTSIAEKNSVLNISVSIC